jgi:hypothetical protein
LARFAAIEVMLNKAEVEFQTRRAAIYYYAYRFAVAFAECGDAKNISETVTCHNSSEFRSYIDPFNSVVALYDFS